MGLDMYFIFVPEENQPDFNETIENEQYYKSSDANVYWRNADVIHCWLEDHLDRQKYPTGQMENSCWYYFSEKTIRELYTACLTVLTGPNDVRQIIPPSRPYDFFRMTSIDNYYFEKIAETYQALAQNLFNPSAEHGGWYTCWY